MDHLKRAEEILDEAFRYDWRTNPQRALLESIAHDVRALAQAKGEER